MPMSTKRKAPVKLAAPIVRSSAKAPTKGTIDESRTSVSATDALQSSHVDVMEISPDRDSDEDISDHEASDEADEANGEQGATKTASTLASVNGKHTSHDNADAELSDREPTSPSFGELLRGNEAIDVPALLQQPSSTTVQRPRTAMAPPLRQSLTTVLGQALRTDDTDLLESCLFIADKTIIRNTLEQIDSTLAGTLLTKLAARLHRRPGRGRILMTWMQWTLICHGGALASQPKVVHILDSLQKVLAERAKGLNSLMVLKGKLDMLDGQLQLRRQMQRGSGLLQGGADGADEEDVIWVEGETDAANGKDMSNGIGSRRKSNVQDGGDGDDDSDDDDEDDVPVTNGFVGDSEAEEGDSDAVEDDGGGDGDDGEELLDEDEVDHDDVDESAGEDESDVEAAPPPSKLQKVDKSSFPKRK